MCFGTANRSAFFNMAESGSLVTVSGAALSLLLYENVRSIGDQIGLLLGEVVVFVTKNVTDSDRQVEHIQTHVDIKTITICPTTDWLCNTVGQVDKERLKDFIRDKNKHVVGWFRYRKNGSLVPTLQDKIFHKELSSSLFSNGSRNHKYFTMCLLNTSVSNHGGTHKYRHVFLQYKNGVFEPITLRINNLGNDSSRPDGSDYKPTPLQQSTSETDAFTKIVESLKLDLVRASGTELVTFIHKAAEHHLEDLIPELAASDREIANLEEQIRELQIKILDKKLSKDRISNLNVSKSNSQREKKEHVSEKKSKAEEIRKELIDMFSDDSQAIINQSMTQRQPFYSNKQKNVVIQPQKNLNINSKNFKQDGAKEKFEPENSKPNTSGVQDPVATVEMVTTMNTTDTSPQERRSLSKELSSSPEFVVAINRSDPDLNTEVSVGQGYGRSFGNRSDPSDSNLGSKKARRGRSKIAPEKFPVPNQTSEQEKLKSAARFDYPGTSLSYSQAARKSNDANPVRSMDSQEY